MSATNDLLTAGGTPSGILITIFLCMINRYTSVDSIAMIIATNRPLLPSSEIGMPPPTIISVAEPSGINGI